MFQHILHNEICPLEKPLSNKLWGFLRWVQSLWISNSAVVLFVKVKLIFVRFGFHIFNGIHLQYRMFRVWIQPATKKPYALYADRRRNTTQWHLFVFYAGLVRGGFISTSSFKKHWTQKKEAQSFETKSLISYRSSSLIINYELWITKS